MSAKSSPAKAGGGHTAANVKIMACTCAHPYQDKRYGQGMRVHNPRKGKTFACTVCGRVKEVA